MFLFPIISIIIIIMLLVFVANSISSNSNNRQPQNYSNNSTLSPKTNQPMDILKERYAKGEISDEEYLKIKKNLE